MSADVDAAPRIELQVLDAASDLAGARAVLRDYAQSLRVSLDFQNFDDEVERLPGVYTPPTGQLLLARVDGAIAGCGAFRSLPELDEPLACEMKRLFVRPAFRRLGLGRRLAHALMDGARDQGYAAMYLDTLDDMEAARELYGSLGFVEVPPFYFNPIAGAHYLRVDLTRPLDW